MALQRNVVYTVTRWMDEWMDWWMDGWMELKIWARVGAGAGRLSHHCLSCVPGVRLSAVFWVFVQFYRRKKERVVRKALSTWRQSGTVFSFFFQHFLLKRPLLNPLPSSTWFSVKPLQIPRYDAKSFFFYQALNRMLEEKKKTQDDVWMKASALAVSHTSLSNTCVTLKASTHLIHFTPRLRKDTVSIQQGKKMEAAVGKDCRCINTEWAGAEKQPHQKILKSHIQSQ